MRNKEQSQEQPSAKKEVKRPGAWSKLLDKFGLGNRWEEEVAYLEYIEEQTPEKTAEAEKAVSRIESQVDAEISTGISELRHDLGSARQDIAALDATDPAIQEELSQIEKMIDEAAPPSNPNSKNSEFIPIETIDVETLDPKEIELTEETPSQSKSSNGAGSTSPSVEIPASYGLEGMVQTPNVFSEFDTEGDEDSETTQESTKPVHLAEEQSGGLEGMVDLPEIVPGFGIDAAHEDYSTTEPLTETETTDIPPERTSTVEEPITEVSTRDIPTTSEIDSTAPIVETVDESTAETSEVELTPRERATKELFAATKELFGKDRIENLEAFQTQQHEFFHRIADNLKDFLPATTEYAVAADEFISEMRALLDELGSFDRNIDRSFIQINEQPDQDEHTLAIKFSKVAETHILDKGTELLQRLEAQTDALNRFIRKTRETADLSHSVEAEEIHQALRNVALATEDVRQDIAEKQRIYNNTVEPAKNNLLAILSAEETETSNAA